VAPEHYEYAARLATGFMDAVCTSGVATGKAVDMSKITTFRRAIGDEAMTLASGITPENAHLYMDDVDGFMVATGINREGDFYNIEPSKLARLLKLTRQHGAKS
jgi:predicted TIM-barrel enzyme